MMKYRVILGAALFVLAGCNMETLKPDPDQEQMKNPADSKNRDTDGKTELSYSSSVQNIWTYVGLGWDAAAGVDYYYYIKDSDRSVWRSADGGTWTNMNFPVRANRIAASNGSSNPNGTSYFDKDQVAVAGEDGYIYLSTGGGWTKFTAQGNFIDVVMDYRKVWGLGTDNKMYFAGETWEYPNSTSAWTKVLDEHPVKAFTITGGSNRPFVSNASSQGFWWQGSAGWLYKNITNVRDVCGTNWGGHLDDWGNVWIALGSGTLAYYDGYGTPATDEWNSWGAFSVSRLGCSNKSRLIIVNFDRKTYIKTE